MRVFGFVFEDVINYSCMRCDMKEQEEERERERERGRDECS